MNEIHNEAMELMLLAETTQRNKEQRENQTFAELYESECRSRKRDAKRHIREVNNLLIFFLMVVAIFAEVLIYLNGPAWLIAVPIILLTLIVRNMR